MKLWRLTPLIALVLAGLLVVAAVAMVAYIDSIYEEQDRRERAIQSQILASSVTAALAFTDTATAQEYVEALSADPEILAAAVYDAQGALFASYIRGEQEGVPPNARAAARHSGEGFLTVLHEVAEGSTVLGTVYMRAVAEPAARRLARFGGLGILAAMAAVLVAALAWAQTTLTRANAELKRRADELDAANRELQAQIEQRERTEEALRQSQKMESIGQLTGGIAHDFNNILTVVIGSLDVLNRRLGDADAEIKPRAERALDYARRAASLVQRLLAFSRRQPLEPRPTDLNRLVAGMSELLRRTIGESIAVETVLAGGLWPAMVDPNQLESAVLNLTVNARDAMPEGGKLTIETANAYLDETYAASHGDVASGQYVMIAVTDTGVGMAPETLHKAMEPFFTTKEAGRGTGLGLPQVYGFVKQSDGHVKIYSEVGEGTTVKLYLPRLVGQNVAATSEAPKTRPVVGGSETILVVEDEEGVRNYAVETLAELGYGTLEAEDGPAALRLLEAHPEVRLLFTDVGLPGGVDGRRLAEQAQAMRPKLKVLFTTGYARNAIVHHGRLDPGVALILKPFTSTTLAQKIRDVLQDER